MLIGFLRTSVATALARVASAFGFSQEDENALIVHRHGVGTFALDSARLAWCSMKVAFDLVASARFYATIAFRTALAPAQVAGNDMRNEECEDITFD